MKPEKTIIRPVNQMTLDEIQKELGLCRLALMHFPLDAISTKMAKERSKELEKELATQS